MPLMWCCGKGPTTPSKSSLKSSIFQVALNIFTSTNYLTTVSHIKVVTLSEKQTENYLLLQLGFSPSVLKSILASFSFALVYALQLYCFLLFLF